MVQIKNLLMLHLCHLLSRGIGWLGIGTLLNGFFGSVTGSTTSVENAGLLALTRVASRRVAQISAGFMILFSLVGLQMSSDHLACTASAGLSKLQFCNLNSFRTKLILGLSFFLGLTIPQYFREHQMVGEQESEVLHHGGVGQGAYRDAYIYPRKNVRGLALLDSTSAPF